MAIAHKQKPKPPNKHQTVHQFKAAVPRTCNLSRIAGTIEAISRAAGLNEYYYLIRPLYHLMGRRSLSGAGFAVHTSDMDPLYSNGCAS